jgi:hypothetical protein
MTARRAWLARLALCCVLGVLGALAAGCFTMQASLPGALRADLADEDVELVAAYSKEIHQPYLVWGLVGSGADDVIAADLLVAVRAANADGAANLLFESYFSPVDVALTTVTLGFVSPRTYVVTADLVRVRAPALPGRRLAPRAAAETEAP